MAKKLLIMLLAACACLAGGCGNKPGTAAKLAENYVSVEGYKNYHMNGWVTVAVCSSDDSVMELPLEVTVMEDVCGSKCRTYTDGISTEDGESYRFTTETYTEDGINYIWNGEGWDETANADFVFMNSEFMNIGKAAERGTFLAIDADDGTSYTITVPLSSYIDADGLLQSLSDSGIASAFSAEGVAAALDESEIIYTFDKDCRLTGISCSTMEFPPAEEGGDSVVFSFYYSFSNFGGISDADVSRDGHESSAAADTEEPEAEDAAPRGATPPESASEEDTVSE